MATKIRPGITKKSQVAPTVATAAEHSSGPVAVATGPRPQPLVPGSITAKVLARVWRGGELTIVDAPPGSGKTALVSNIVANLATRTDMKILVTTPTRAQCLAFARRLSLELPIDKIKIDMKDIDPEDLPEGYNADRTELRNPIVTVATLAKAKFIDKSNIDLLVVDEAYQATHALVAQAQSGVAQVLMVGDPGQIGPVVTVDTSIWEGQKDAPHLPAPLVTKGATDVVRFSLDVTYRLGPKSAKIIAPIYKFPFTSARPPRYVVTTDGEVVGEIETVEVEHSDEVDNLDCLATMVRRAASFAGGSLIEGDESRPLRAEDIALVVSRNSQVSIVTGMSRSLGHDFVIGTADRLQGGEWPVVIALDPMYGSNGETEHNQSIGRLCVMVSRHTSHLSWVHDDSWVEATAGNDRIDRINRKVRESMVGTVAEVDIFDPDF
jgi:hypothetical protein